MRLTVYFAEQFWVGVLEEANKDGSVRACRHIFGAEPKDTEILVFVQQQMLRCLERTRPQPAAGTVSTVTASRTSPKRLARQVAKELGQRGPSTKAQQALSQELEQRKQERKTLTREHKEAEKDRKRELAREKAKQKHRGH